MEKICWKKFIEEKIVKFIEIVETPTGIRSRYQDDSLMEQSSYMMEHSIGTDMEFSTINRLLADFNINRDSSVSSRRSPLKMLKISGDSLRDGESYVLQRTEEVFERTNISHARVQGTSYKPTHKCLAEINCQRFFHLFLS